MKYFLLLVALLTATCCFGQSANSRIPCSTDPAFSNPTVTVCTPQMDAVTTSPVRVVAAGSAPAPFKVMQVYVDGKKYAEFNASYIDFNLRLADGPHRVSVQLRDATGAGAINTFYVFIYSE